MYVLSSSAKMLFVSTATSYIVHSIMHREFLQLFDIRLPSVITVQVLLVVSLLKVYTYIDHAICALEI